MSNNNPASNAHHYFHTMLEQRYAMVAGEMRGPRLSGHTPVYRNAEEFLTVLKEMCLELGQGDLTEGWLGGQNQPSISGFLNQLDSMGVRRNHAKILGAMLGLKPDTDAYMDFLQNAHASYMKWRPKTDKSWKNSRTLSSDAIYRLWQQKMEAVTPGFRNVLDSAAPAATAEVTADDIAARPLPYYSHESLAVHHFATREIHRG